MNTTKDGRPVLSLADLKEFDPQAPANRCWCPLCGVDKPRDSAHRSLSFDIATGKWKCFRCGVGGILREFWRETQRPTSSGPGQGRVVPRQSHLLLSPVIEPTSNIQPPPIAAGPLSSQETKPIPTVPAAIIPTSTPLAWRSKWEETVPLENTPGAAYLEGRGITLETAQVAGVRFSANWNAEPDGTACGSPVKVRRAMPAVVFPIRDQLGAIVAAQARAIRGSAKLTAGPKKHGAFFAPVQMKSGRVFSPHDRNTPVIAITEAPMDALSLAVAGFPALALCGTSGPSWLHIACGLRRVALALDADEAGEKAAAELERLLTPFGARCERLRPESAKDWNELLQEQGIRVLADLLMTKLL